VVNLHRFPAPQPLGFSAEFTDAARVALAGIFSQAFGWGLIHRQGAHNSDSAPLLICGGPRIGCSHPVRAGSPERDQVVSTSHSWNKPTDIYAPHQPFPSNQLGLSGAWLAASHLDKKPWRAGPRL